MNEKEFVEKYTSEIPIYSEWGRYVLDHIISELNKKDFDPSLLLKIYPVEPRIKDIQSIVDKAYCRHKNYANPYEDITDKVGLRFVVLTESDIDIFKKIIEEWTDITQTKDCDYEQLLKATPNKFTYKSVHYVLKNKSEIDSHGIIIPSGTPCEIQIRTLLQHAWAELSHSEIYKREDTIDPLVKRKMARSVALIEATDELFQNVHDTLSENENIFNHFIQELRNFLPYNDGFRYLRGTNHLIYFAYLDRIHQKNITPADLKTFMERRPHLIENIIRINDNLALYQQPIMCLVYYLIKEESVLVNYLWPLLPSELDPLFSDLGVSTGRD
jgi:ppGpp synthetase/RelA/SpoT-type nucleotidyltranferase